MHCVLNKALFVYGDFRNDSANRWMNTTGFLTFFFFNNFRMVYFHNCVKMFRLLVSWECG